jgi:hypothetical protein
MRDCLFLPLIPLLAAIAAPAGADPINYDQIPADVTGFLQWNMEGFLASRIATEIGITAQVAEKLNAGLGGKFQSITIYSRGGAEPTGVVLVHVTLSADAHKRLEELVANETDSVAFNYGSHEVHYSTGTLQEMIATAGAAYTKAVFPTATQPSAESKSAGAEPKHTRFELGLDTGGKTADFDKGHPYVCFVGDNLIVGTIDLPSMAHALDVLDGKKPSLSKEDPKGLKSVLPQGVIVVGAGLNAVLDTDANDPAGSSLAAKPPVKIADKGPGGFDLDLFGSFKGKAVLARVDAGENATDDFADASFGMIDTDSAEQLKNLIVGVKALVSLSNAKEKPLIDPLEVNADGKTVLLHWSWPTAKLVALIEESRGSNKHEGSSPFTPAPVH